MNIVPDSRHLSDAELFDLAAAALGEGAGRPRHLASCAGCARRLDAWARTLRELSPEGDPAVPAWLEARTMERVRRRAARPRWGFGPLATLAAAAAALAVAIGLGVPLRPAGPAKAADVAARGSSGLSPADRADDALLRDIARLVNGNDEAAWKELAPLPKVEERS